MKSIHDCYLYSFIDTAYLRDRRPEIVAQQLCDGGSDLIQLRAKHSSPEEVERMANAVLPVVDAAGVGLVINDFPEVAAKLGAAWCHLGQEDFSGYSNVDQIFSRFPSPISRSAPFQIGLSTHNPAQAERAIAAKAGYIGVGPVFPTATKPLVKPVTLEYVRWAAQHVSIAWFAIGGITLENVEEVIEAGARRVCVVSAILEAPDLVEACQKFKDRLTSARGND